MSISIAARARSHNSLQCCFSVLNLAELDPRHDQFGSANNDESAGPLMSVVALVLRNHQKNDGSWWLNDYLSLYLFTWLMMVIFYNCSLQGDCLIMLVTFTVNVSRPISQPLPTLNDGVAIWISSLRGSPQVIAVNCHLWPSWWW